jgi:hypothetical protein
MLVHDPSKGYGVWKNGVFTSISGSLAGACWSNEEQPVKQFRTEPKNHVMRPYQLLLTTLLTLSLHSLSAQVRKSLDRLPASGPRDRVGLNLGGTISTDPQTQQHMQTEWQLPPAQWLEQDCSNSGR